MISLIVKDKVAAGVNQLPVISHIGYLKSAVSGKVISTLGIPHHKESVIGKGIIQRLSVIGKSAYIPLKIGLIHILTVTCVPFGLGGSLLGVDTIGEARTKRLIAYGVNVGYIVGGYIHSALLSDHAGSRGVKSYVHTYHSFPENIAFLSFFILSVFKAIPRARSLCGVALKLGNLYRLLVYAVEAS